MTNVSPSFAEDLIPAGPSDCDLHPVFDASDLSFEELVEINGGSWTRVEVGAIALSSASFALARITPIPHARAALYATGTAMAGVAWVADKASSM